MQMQDAGCGNGWVAFCALDALSYTTSPESSASNMHNFRDTWLRRWDRRRALRFSWPQLQQSNWTKVISRCGTLRLSSVCGISFLHLEASHPSSLSNTPHIWYLVNHNKHETHSRLWCACTFSYCQYCTTSLLCQSFPKFRGSWILSSSVTRRLPRLPIISMVKEQISLKNLSILPRLVARLPPIACRVAELLPPAPPSSCKLSCCRNHLVACVTLLRCKAFRWQRFCICLLRGERRLVACKIKSYPPFRPFTRCFSVAASLRSSQTSQALSLEEPDAGTTRLLVVWRLGPEGHPCNHDHC